MVIVIAYFGEIRLILDNSYVLLILVERNQRIINLVIQVSSYLLFRPSSGTSSLVKSSPSDGGLAPSWSWLGLLCWAAATMMTKWRRTELPPISIFTLDWTRIRWRTLWASWRPRWSLCATASVPGSSRCWWTLRPSQPSRLLARRAPSCDRHRVKYSWLPL